MAKVSDNRIRYLREDWGNDENTNLPFSGQEVQRFIKSYLQNVTAAAWFDPRVSTLYFFSSEFDRDSFINDTSLTTLPVFTCPMDFSGTLYQVKVTNNNLATDLNVATNSMTLPLSLSYVVQEKDVTATNWADTARACMVSILIDRYMTGEYEQIKEPELYNPGTTITFDIFDYLALGTNRVKFQFEETDGKITSSFIYTINLAELYVELFNNRWYVPIVENDESSRRLGGFRIAGAGYKYLHISFYNQQGQQVTSDISLSIGTTNSWASTPYYYQNLSQEILDLPTGVYTVKVYVSTQNVNSEPLFYNVMFVAAEDTATAQLVCVNDVADRAYNYAEANLCNYAVYNGGSSYADVVVTYTYKNNGVIITTDDPMILPNKPTSTQNTLSYAIEWPTIFGDGYSIGFEIAIGNSSVYNDVPIDNSTVFPPTPNYDFYLLPSQRENSESSSARNKFINIADNSQLQANWTNVDFIDEIDGWTTDDTKTNNTPGRSCLRIPAGTRVELPYTAFNLLSGDNQTFEICYKAANVADYDENIITLSPNPDAAGFKGIRIKPTNITVHSSANTDGSEDSKQGTNLCDEENVHFVLTINPYYQGDHMLVKGFVNGCKNFLFEYTNRNQWANFNPTLTIGSDKTDVFVYFIRHYPVSLSDDAVQVNYISSLTTVEERNTVNDKFDSVLDAGRTEIDYEAVKNSNYNFFVITMTQGSHIPSAAEPNPWTKETSGISELEMHFGEHPEWDWKLSEIETTGQGTTSMNYYRWNVRWRIDKSNKNTDNEKKVPISYCVSRTKSGGKYQYEWSEPSYSKTLRFDGTNHPPLMRITAKINSASSMQSHKIGATRAYTELHDAIGLSNEAQVGASPRPTVSVYEYPAFGFEYDPDHDVYTFVGLFTIGPDKGDKPTFGYDRVKNALISLEGTDHNQPLATFSYPYLEGTGTGDVNYFYTQEGIGIKKSDGTFLTGIEISNCHDLEIDKSKGASDEDNVRSVLHDEFKPAYDLVWHNSTLIFPIGLNDPTYYGADASEVLTKIRNNKAAFIATQYSKDKRMTYADMQFWIEGEYKLYWYNPVIADFVEGDSLGAPTGATLEEQNENYKAARRASFMSQAENWWDIEDALFHFDFCLIFGASDNFAKNSYPYIMATHANGGKWKWRQDDLDTIFDIDNMGQDTKPYYIEFMDDNNGVPYFAGGRSLFWNLLYECYWSDYTSTITNIPTRGGRTIGQNIIAEMTTLSGSTNQYEGFINYVSKCFWDNAQNYFPESAYNVNSVYMYEMAWLNGRSEALPQALGNHYSGERLWVKRRAVYMLSLFHYGPFAEYSATYLGRVRFRPDAVNYAPTPVMWLYPALLTGAGGIVSGDRTETGHQCPLVYTGTLGETEFYFAATDYLSSFGDLRDLHLVSGYVNTLGIEGDKLVTFKIGDTNSNNVTTNVPGLMFTETKCLEEIDARNASSIRSITGLSDCKRLRSLKLIGTNITDVDIPSGSKIETLSLPSTIQQVSLNKLYHLSSITDDNYSDVTTINIEDCPLIDAFAILEDVKNNSNSLRSIRIVWPGVHVSNSPDILQTLIDLYDGNYNGISATGDSVAEPFIDGTIDITGYSGQMIFPVWLNVTNDTAYSNGKRKAQIDNFNTGLSIIYNTASTRFIGFLKEVGGGKIKTSDNKYVTL